MGGLWLTVTAVGCGGVDIPYAYETIVPRARPSHPLRIAVLPLVDARRVDERGGATDRFVYRQREYRGTVLEDLKGRPEDRITEVLARHLAQRRVFAQVMVVRRAEQAPDADLILDGRILRCRGYVEVEAAEPPPGRRADPRQVLAEVVLEDLRLTRPDGAVWLHADAGWSIADAVDEPGTPWTVATAALRRAIDGFVDLVEKADLTGAFEVRKRVRLPKRRRREPGARHPDVPSAPAKFGELASSPPPGWRFSRAPAGPPTGWQGPTPCVAACLRWRQTRRFFRRIGPYQPSVCLWACPKTARYRRDRNVDFPAELLGESHNDRYFHWALGETNWPTSVEDLQRHLGLASPGSRHVFEVGPAATSTSAARRQGLFEPGIRASGSLRSLR